MCWLNKPKKAVSTRHSWSKIVFQYLYFYFYILHFNSNIFRFPELSASTNFSPKEDMFLQTSTESLKSGKLLPFLGTFTVKEKDSHKLQSSQSLFTSQKNCQLTKSVTSSGISAHGVYICSQKSYILKTCCILDCGSYSNIHSRNNFLQGTDKSLC